MYENYSWYDKLPDKNYLSLICNEQLTSAVGSHYKLKSVEEIRSFVEHKTVRAIDTINLVYYEKEIWWLVGFVHGEFTVLSDKLTVVDDKYLDDFLNNLGLGLYNLVNLFDPQTIFIGGGIVERPGFLALLRKHLAWFGIEQSIDTVSHGNDAGLIGAVYHFNQQSDQS